MSLLYIALSFYIIPRVFAQTWRNLDFSQDNAAFQLVACRYNIEFITLPHPHWQ